jgi:hypothetical protein
MPSCASFRGITLVPVRKLSDYDANRQFIQIKKTTCFPSHGVLRPIFAARKGGYVMVPTMRLADRIAQCRTPLVVQNTKDRTLTHLSCAASFAGKMATCPTRYVLTDDLTRLCTALAYSKGANTLACADFLRVPAQRVWIEWCDQPWLTELARYGFKSSQDSTGAGRRGVYIQSDPLGRSGLIRTFWSMGGSDSDVRASSVEAFFDFDTPEGVEPSAADFPDRRTMNVSDPQSDRADILERCFRFRYETTWAEYYAKGGLSSLEEEAVAQMALGTIAPTIPVTLAFCLLLATRPGLPQRPLMLERLNRARTKSGKAPLLDHTEVHSPLLPEYSCVAESGSGVGRRPARLHHVRGHLVRRGAQLFWRVPHLRGSARTGVLRSRTVTWTIDRSNAFGHSPVA